MITALIASFLESDCIDAIREAVPDVKVSYEPELLPPPRYPADHDGREFDLAEHGQRRWRDLLRSADVMFDFDWESPEVMPVRCPNLRWLQATSAGIGDVVEKSHLADAPFAITTAAGVHAGPLTEFVIGGLLYLVRDFPRLEQDKADRRWERWASHEIAGKSALIVGLGSVGRRVGLALHHLDVRVTGLARRAQSETPDGFSKVITSAELEADLPSTDFLIICCPLTNETRGLIGRTEIDLLPEGAIVTNIGRGPVIDENALLTNLRGGRLRGAILDVFDEEPLPLDSPFWTLKNVVVSPHSASTVAGENARLTALFIANLKRFSSGEPLLNRFESTRGY